MLAAPSAEALRLHPLEFVDLADVRHTTDRWASKPFAVRRWQRDILKELFKERRGRRVYNQALIGMPRKNGKSELGSLIGLVLAFADGVYGAEVYAAAGDKDQARRVFDATKRMVMLSNVLRDQVRVYRDSIYDPGSESIYRVVSSDAPLKHGLNPSGVVFDEIWNQPNDELWEALTTGSGTREEPLIVALTTAGYDKDSLGYRLYERGVRGDDPRFYFWWAGLPKDSDLDYRDPKAWKLANPALGDFLRQQFLEDELRRLPEVSFRRWHLNQWTSAVSTWVRSEVWEACSEPAVINEGDAVWVGVAGTSNRNVAAVAVVKDGEDGLHAEMRFFDPPSEGATVNPDTIGAYIRELYGNHELQGVRYLPLFWQLGRELESEYGEEVVLQVPQGPKRKASYSQALFDAVVQGRLRHGGDPVLRTHAEAAVAEAREEGWVLQPLKAVSPISGVLALAMAVEAAVEAEDTDTPGIQVLDLSEEDEEDKGD